ncbi:MAG TPA: hypothetical protein VFD64_07055 [Gemmatimonadaceae bacterium]|nr:hypothetical protein [Gemmatimonadaceae bacterium]
MNLTSRLAQEGITCRIEVRDRLAIIVAAPGYLTAAVRADVLRLAKEEGFTHLALELDPDGAALPGN